MSTVGKIGAASRKGIKKLWKKAEKRDRAAKAKKNRELMKLRRAEASAERRMAREARMKEKKLASRLAMVTGGHARVKL